MLQAEILHEETYQRGKAQRRVLSINNGVVTYRVIARASGRAHREGSEFSCSLAAFAAWAEERVRP